MKIAVLSGKGGTGKTLVSVNLASVIENSTYIDCDVEEPNGRLFFKPEDIKTRSVKVMLPKQDFYMIANKYTFTHFAAHSAHEPWT